MRTALLPQFISQEAARTGDPMQSIQELSNRDSYSPHELPLLLRQTLLLAGHRNWIVVADAAYPYHAHPAVATVLSTGTIIDALNYLLPDIHSLPHLQPHFYLDRELSVLHESDTQGVTTLRHNLHRHLEDFQSLPHEELLHKVNAAAHSYHVLVVKTSTLIPYSSVFIELQCGYWNEQAEAQLRSRLQAIHPS